MWKHHITDSENLPKWTELDTFLQKRIRALAFDGGAAAPSHNNDRSKPDKVVRTHLSTTKRPLPNDRAQQRVCVYCGGHHFITCCEPFHRLSVPERRRAAAGKALCFLCLASGHRADACKSARMCEHCGAKHNSMLHVNMNIARANESAAAPATAAEAPERVTTDVSSVDATPPGGAHVLLPTAVVNVRDVNGGVHKMRALLDQGSEASMVSLRAAEILQLPRRCASVTVEGIGGVNAGRCEQSIVMKVSDQYGMGYSVDVNALVMPRVTSRVKPAPVQSTLPWPHVEDLLLADPDFMQEDTIDILLGGDLYGTLLRPGLRQRAGWPTAQNTMLGWIVSGAASAISPAAAANVVAVGHHVIVTPMARCLGMEEPATVRRLTADDENCEQLVSEQSSVAVLQTVC